MAPKECFGSIQLLKCMLVAAIVYAHAEKKSTNNLWCEVILLLQIAANMSCFACVFIAHLLAMNGAENVN